MEVSAKNISKKSLFKLLFQSVGFGLFSLCLLMGVFSIFGFETVSWNEEQVVGLNGFLVSIGLGLFMSIFMTCFMWLMGILGLWINSFFHGVTITFKDVNSNSGE